jgi:hypothetical protein
MDFYSSTYRVYTYLGTVHIVRGRLEHFLAAVTRPRSDRPKGWKPSNPGRDPRDKADLDLPLFQDVLVWALCTAHVI